jgi:hypothetical protein
LRLLPAKEALPRADTSLRIVPVATLKMGQPTTSRKAQQYKTTSIDKSVCSRRVGVKTIDVLDHASNALASRSGCNLVLPS